MLKLIRNLDDFTETLDPEKYLFCDTETYEQQGQTSGGLYGNVRLIQCYQEGMKYALLFDCLFVDLATVLDIIKPFKHVYHNASYDLGTINCHTKDLWLPADVDDTLYLSRIALYDKGPRFGFYECLKHIGRHDKCLQGIDKKENQQADWGGPLSQQMQEYAAYDVLYLCILFAEVQDSLNNPMYILDKFNLKYAQEYQRRGIPINQTEVKKRIGTNLSELESVLSRLPVNPNSPKQCCELLGTTSSDKDTLVHQALLGNSYAADIRDARKLSKTVMFLKKFDRPVMKGFYNPCGTISGRMSCTGGDRFDHENMQQIPRRILDVIQAPDGYVIVYKDYAGLELRMACCWIGEPTMAEMIFKGVDLHSYTGSILYEKPADQLTKHERMIGKIANFLLIYGGGITLLQATIRAWGEILEDIHTCKMIHSKWFEAYPYFKEWHAMHKRLLQVYGFIDIYTALGRPVRTYSIPDSLNVPIQGSSSEVTKTSLMYLKTRYPDEYLINTIHDSNAVLVREDVADLWVGRLNECMVDAWFHVIKGLSMPDLPMPPEAEYKKVWSF